MKNLFLCLLTIFALFGCSNNGVNVPTGDINNSSEITGIPDLLGCKVFIINSFNTSNLIDNLYVIKCPTGLMTTQYSTGGKAKRSVSTTLILDSNH